MQNNKFIWWKGIALGPFSDEQLSSLNYPNVELFVDKAIENDIIPKTPPLSKSMEENPNVPHIFFKP